MINNRKILVFGGSFSPPTLAHEAIIELCLSLPGFDEVWIMPSGDRADKNIAMSDQDRLRMMEIIKAERFDHDPRLCVSDFELGLPHPTQTYKTVHALTTRFAGTDFWFAYGVDAYKSMPDWPHGAALRRGLRMIVFGEHSIPLVDHNHMYMHFGGEYADLSSTQARSALAAGRSLDGIVSSPIQKYLTS